MFSVSLPVCVGIEPDGRGAFFVSGGNGVVEIFGAAHGEPSYVAPPPASFMIVVIVDDVEAYHEKLVAKGAEIRWPMEKHEWGKYFGVVDPNEVGFYFMQRLGENVAIAKEALRKAVSNVAVRNGPNSTQK